MIGKNICTSSVDGDFLRLLPERWRRRSSCQVKLPRRGWLSTGPSSWPEAETLGSLPPLKQIDAGVLNVGYVEAGPIDEPAAILLHGWPYDIHSLDKVTPRLASAGFRVIAPYTRGYGLSSFLSNETPPTGRPSALAVDMIALMDALNIKQAIIAGFDWGARSADIVAALWPDRVKGIVSVSGYLIGSQEAGRMPLPPKTELQWWYQYYFATERGREGYSKYRRVFAELIRKLASPKWAFDARSSVAFDNPDHADIVIHNYRWRLGLVQGDPGLDQLEAKLAAAPQVTVPTRPSPLKAMRAARHVTSRSAPAKYMLRPSGVKRCTYHRATVRKSTSSRALARSALPRLAIGPKRRARPPEMD
jgi:pimeloyl-ACP methyl ester carboxylesterase